MKRAIIFFLALAALAASQTRAVRSQTVSPDYTIRRFSSNIVINQDTSLTITETTEADFALAKHGIFRVIPVVYSAHGKTIKARLKILSVTDEKANPYPYKTSRLKQSVKLKIGDPDKAIAGLHTYIIKYQINKVILRYQEHDEVYWNVTGSEWETSIEKASAKIESPFAPIQKVDCFAGKTGSQEKNCLASRQKETARFATTAPLVWGKDFTIVAALDKNNQLNFPGPIRRIIGFLIDNWGYPAALAPFFIILYFWYKKGRDLKYVEGNIFYRPENRKTVSTPLFAREHLPLVYSPINGLTPAEVGTIIDERVDVQDVVAEIIELARLGYFKIKKIEKKKRLGKRIDYLFTKKNKSPKQLKDYQKYLLKKLFADGKTEVLLSSLKNNFYKHLAQFKKDLYSHLACEKIFDGNPEKVILKWFGLYAVFVFFGFLAVIIFATQTTNSSPFFFLFASLLPAVFLIKNMPRRTAWGHSLFRQTLGLRWYLDKGKWRQEIAEKHLFFQEILPLAISLGVVKKLTQDMAVLNVKSPDYFVTASPALLYTDLNHFSTQAARSLTASPSPSGSSSWSGGSGFSGGSSGGGFGGGGGGSW